MTQAIRAVKDVVLKNITPQGLTTAEIFKLTQTMQNPPQFRPALLPKNAAPPPFPRKLIRSQAYLKRWVLPILEGDGTIRTQQVLRQTTLSDAPSEKGKGAAPASSGPRQKTERIWAWVADPISLPESKDSEDQSPETPVDVDPQWYNLKSHPKRFRFFRAVNHYQAMRQARFGGGGRGGSSSESGQQVEYHYYGQHIADKRRYYGPKTKNRRYNGQQAAYNRHFDAQQMAYNRHYDGQQIAYNRRYNGQQVASERRYSGQQAASSKHRAASKSLDR
ncbi:hypothetical protein AX14_000976 [Amanita brunnescens Koide BX004]|nr:hypothetical protein AX14_000976 [Amanita brunnescens Koide BX004]